MAKPAEQMRLVQFGPFEANFTTGELRKHGIRLKLQDQPLQILKMLLARPGELVTREEIRQSLWPSGTFVDFDNGLNAAVNRLREALGDSAEEPRFIETLPRRGYRFMGAGDADASVGEKNSLPSNPLATQSSVGDGAATTTKARARGFAREHLKKIVAASLTIAVAATGAYFYFHRAPVLKQKKTIVLADFKNTTGDAAFDDTLRQALVVQLDQSPFLNILSDTRVRETLRLMGRSPDASVDGEAAREICQRTGSAVVLSGSIASLGSQYVLGLSAVDCRTGDALAAQQVQAAGKERVLSAIDQATAILRGRLGESLSSIQEFDVPVEQATTSSLVALKAFSLGLKARREGDEEQALAMFRRAVEVDPNFAMAYGVLGASYNILGDIERGIENVQKAYDLRQRTSERERFRISSYYYLFVTGELEKMRETCEEWVLVYPGDAVAHALLADALGRLGRYVSAIEEDRESLRLNPDSTYEYNNLMEYQRALGRLDEAKAVLQEMKQHEPDGPDFHFGLYFLASVRGDEAGMQEQVGWFAENPKDADFMLELRANAEAFSGYLEGARELIQLRAEHARRARDREREAQPRIEEAQWEVEFGNPESARRQALEFLPETSSRHAQLLAALILARTGDAARAEAVASKVSKRFPLDTLVNGYWLPTIGAAIELRQNHAARAIELLQAAIPYELAAPSEFTPRYPAYLRGEAYIVLHHGSQAAGEFQKFLDHRSLVVRPLAVLAHLGLARAYALEAMTEQGAEADNSDSKSRAAYQDFLTLWKNADPDIPILKEARAEYARLQ